MDYRTTYTVSAESWFRGECDFDISEEGPDRDTVLRTVLTKLVDEKHGLPTKLVVSSRKTITLPTEDGEEVFTSEPIEHERMDHKAVEALPCWSELTTAQKAAEDAAREASRKRTDEQIKADRLKIYLEVKKEQEEMSRE